MFEIEILSMQSEWQGTGEEFGTPEEAKQFAMMVYDDDWCWRVVDSDGNEID